MSPALTTRACMQARDLIDEAVENREQKAKQRHKEYERKREAKSAQRQLYHLPPHARLRGAWRGNRHLQGKPPTCSPCAATAVWRAVIWLQSCGAHRRSFDTSCLVDRHCT